MRISQQNENSFWKTSDQPASSQRAQKAHNSLKTFCFPKSARLLSREDFQRVYHARNRFSGEVVVIDYRSTKQVFPRLGITVSRRFGKAFLRNHFKRLVRESFRLNRVHFPLGFEINVSPRQGNTLPSMEQIVADFLNLAALFRG